MQRKFMNPAVFLMLAVTQLLPFSAPAAQGADSPTSNVPSTQWALLIGIDDYLAQPPLAGSVADCTALALILRNQYGFARIIELYNEKATRPEIIRTLRDLTGRMRAEDELLVVFNARGFLDPDDKEADWIAHDTLGETDTIPSELIQTLLRSAKMRHVLVLSAAGFSARAVEALDLEAISSPAVTTLSPSASRRSRQVAAFNAAGFFPADESGGKGSLIRAVSRVLAESGRQTLGASELMAQLGKAGKDAKEGLLFGSIRNSGHEGGVYVFGARPVVEGVVSGVVVYADSKLPAQNLTVEIQGSDRKGRTSSLGEFRLWAPPGLYSGLIFEGTAPGDVVVFPIELQINPSEEVEVEGLEIAFGPSAPNQARQPLPPPPMAETPSLKPRITSPIPSPEVGEPSMTFEFVTLDGRGKIREKIPGKVALLRQDLGGGAYMDLAPVPGGVFWRGSDPAEEGHQPSEDPRSEVTISPFHMGVCEVTQAQWGAVAAMPPVERDLPPDPSYFKGDQRPVEMVSWEDCVEFCLRLSQQTGKPFRLPSEAEWEFACRAGTDTPFSLGPTLTTELANYFGSTPYASGPSGLARNQTLEVGVNGYPNAFGLFDMHGNVAEWCADPWHPNYSGAPLDGAPWEAGGDRFLRVYRGGSWRSFAVDLRSAERKGLTSTLRYNILGFRVAMDSAKSLSQNTYGQ
jgi:formylglycine-generating enzyme required for sulfatase activity